MIVTEQGLYANSGLAEMLLLVEGLTTYTMQLC